MFGKVFGWLFGGGVKKVAEGVVDVKEAFGGNKEKSLQRSHDLDMAVLAQFAAEYSARENRTWWDSLVDGLNRLPRPLFALWIMFLFIMPTFWPQKFIAMMTGYKLVPEGLWILFGTIVTFYFGGRMQLKSQDFTLKKNAVAVAKEVAEFQRQQFGWMSDKDKEYAPSMTDREFEAAMKDNSKTLSNEAILEWNRRKKGLR